MVINLGHAIAVLHPTARPNVDYEVSQGGDGSFRIAKWNTQQLGPQPAIDAPELLAADLEAYRAARCDAIDRRSAKLIGRGFTFDGATFSLSANAQLNWTALFAVRDNPAVVYPVLVTTDADGQHSFANATALAGLCLTALGTVRAILDSGRSLKLAVNAATDAAGIDAVVDTRGT